MAEQPGNDAIVALGGMWDMGLINDYDLSDNPGPFLHELGHNLGLGHGGGDDLENKPNYLSVMNPMFEVRMIGRRPYHGASDWFSAMAFDPAMGFTVDYSGYAADLDENHLNENNGVGIPW